MEQLRLPINPASPAATDPPLGQSPVPAYLLARLDQWLRENPSPKDERLRRIAVYGCVPAYANLGKPNDRRPQPITQALREHSLSRHEAAIALRITIDRMRALEETQHDLSARELLLIVPQFEAYRRNETALFLRDSAYCTTDRKSPSANAYRARAFIESQLATKRGAANG